MLWASRLLLQSGKFNRGSGIPFRMKIQGVVILRRRKLRPPEGRTASVS